jgi:hypothetical protein
VPCSYQVCQALAKETRLGERTVAQEAVRNKDNSVVLGTTRQIWSIASSPGIAASARSQVTGRVPRAHVAKVDHAADEQGPVVQVVGESSAQRGLGLDMPENPVVDTTEHSPDALPIGASCRMTRVVMVNVQPHGVGLAAE